MGEHEFPSLDSRKGNGEEILNSRAVCKERIHGMWEFVEGDGNESVGKSLLGFFLDNSGVSKLEKVIFGENEMLRLPDCELCDGGDRGQLVPPPLGPQVSRTVLDTLTPLGAKGILTKLMATYPDIYIVIKGEL